MTPAAAEAATPTLTTATLYMIIPPVTLRRAAARSSWLLLVVAFLTGFGGANRGVVSGGPEGSAQQTTANGGVAPVAPGSTVDIKGSTPGWRDLLVEAVQVEGTTVRLGPDVDMDMSGLGTIFVARGVTLTSVSDFGPLKTADTGNRDSPTARIAKRTQARSPRTLGPRLYTKTRPEPLFQVECYPGGAINDNVHFSGFRLQGADLGIESADDHLQAGIQIVNCVGIEISNMELSGWSGEAIRITDDPRFAGRGRIDGPEQVWIHDNFIHHNQHEGAEGYGVDVSIGANALIQRNVFDFNRHAIAASGTSDGYVAERNLVLKGGGYHKLGFHTHIFDVHGTSNCGLKGLVNDSAWNCGRAGGSLSYRENAFQYVNGDDIKLRGTPGVQASIVQNVFALSSLQSAVSSAAVELSQGAKNVSFGMGQFANVTGFDPFGKYGVCDFDGDGRDDLFLATGITWWFASSGDMNWSYLNAATERLDQVKLGYFDNDLRCDVLTASGDHWSISSGGTAPWRDLGAFGTLSDVAFGQFGNVKDLSPGHTRLTTHAFRRGADGQWYVTELTAPNWQPAQSSSIAMSKLRFGDFTGDGITDVLAVQGGRWSISDGATGPWQKLNPNLSDDLQFVLIADVDNDNHDDILRLSGGWSGKEGGWEVSWGGRTDWKRLKTLSGLTPVKTTGFPQSTYTLHPFAGRFDATPGVDLLVIDATRTGLFFNSTIGFWHSVYDY